MGREERQDGRGAGHREVVRAADPEHRVPPEHQIPERAAPDAGEAGEKEKPHDIKLGARRFEAELMTLQGHAVGELGAGADAQVLLQRASALALEVARTYCGPWCLGIQALHTPNVDRARELLVQGEALLADGCVSHNHLEFRRAAMELGLRNGNLRETRRHAAALRTYTEDEPLAWSSLVIDRALYLADRAEDPSRADLPARREALLRDVQAADFRWLLRDL